MKGLTDFKILFEEYYSPLCNYACAIVKDGAIAEDIVQQLFIQLWEKQTLVETIINIEAYLMRALKYKCLDYTRSSKNRFTTVELPNDLVETSFEYAELQEEDIIPLLHFFAAQLPPKTQEVFLLSRVEGYSNQQIADTMSISIKTVENQMTRALRQMRVLLKDHHYLQALIAIIFNGE